MLAAKLCDLVAVLIENTSGQICRFASRSEGFEVDAVFTATEQISALWIESQINGLKQNGNCPGSCFDDATIFNSHGDSTFASLNRFR